MTTERGWARRFDDAMMPPDGRKLVTLLETATYATKPPRNDRAGINRLSRRKLKSNSANEAAKRGAKNIKT